MHQHINRRRASGTVLDSASTRTLRRFSLVVPVPQGRRRRQSSAPAAAATAAASGSRARSCPATPCASRPARRPWGGAFWRRRRPQRSSATRRRDASARDGFLSRRVWRRAAAALGVPPRQLAASRGPAVAAYTARQIPEDTTYLPSAAADGDAAAPSGRRRPEVPAGAQRCRRRGTVAERISGTPSMRVRVGQLRL